MDWGVAELSESTEDLPVAHWSVTVSSFSELARLLTVHSGFSSHHMEGKVGGGGPLVKIQVESGSIRVD